MHFLVIFGYHVWSLGDVLQILTALGGVFTPVAALRAGAASVCLLSMTFLLGASRLGFFVSLRLTDAFGGIEISFLLGAPL